MKNQERLEHLDSLFKGKRITKMGLGPNGRSFGDIIFLLNHGAHVLVTDLRDDPDVQASRNNLLSELTEDEQLRIGFVLGEHREKDFVDTDMVFKASGVPKDSPYLLASEKAGVPVITSSAFVYQYVQSHLDAVTIGVTGTKGKSTTTDMIEHLLKENNISYHVAGNVRGVANLPVLDEIQDGDVLLGELDSWQLQGFGDLKISPNISLFTSFFEDHLNYYKGSMQAYFDDKALIYKYQNPEDLTLISEQLATVIDKYEHDIPENMIVVGTDLMQNISMQTIGSHVRGNAALAFAAAEQLGLSPEQISAALETYSAMEGRLRYLGEKSGVHYYDDNNSTTPESTMKAIDAMREAHPGARVHVLGGGADKKFDYSAFGPYLEESVETAALFAGAATDKIIDSFVSKDLTYEVVDSMQSAWDFVHGHVKPGDVVALSPGAASFGVFLNEYERGDQFNELYKESK